MTTTAVTVGGASCDAYLAEACSVGRRLFLARLPAVLTGPEDQPTYLCCSTESAAPTAPFRLRVKTDGTNLLAFPAKTIGRCGRMRH